MTSELVDKKFHMMYLKNSKNQPYGLILAFLDTATHTVKFGWSKVGYNEKTDRFKDVFDKSRAQKIAFHRAASVGLRKVPKDFTPSFVNRFVEDCKEYFTPKVPAFSAEVSYKA